jgi:hypothetical protein
MTESNNINELFDKLAKILLRCFVLGYIVVLLWFVSSLVGGELIYGYLGGKLYGLTQHEVDMVNYCGMALMKCFVWLFFLIPYIAIRWFLSKRN